MISNQLFYKIKSQIIYIYTHFTFTFNSLRTTSMNNQSIIQLVYDNIYL